MMISFDQFVAKWLHKEADWDGFYAGQCVDLFRYYCHEVLGIKQPDGVWGAANFWVDFETDPVLVASFVRIPNSPNFIPRKGDVMVWDWDAGGGFGHIAMVSDNNSTLHTFRSFDQNWSRISYCEIVTHDYDDCYGVLRPKIINNGENMSDEHARLVDKSNNWDRTFDLLRLPGNKEDKDGDKKVQEVVDRYNKTIEDQNNKIKELNKNLKEVESSLEECRNRPPTVEPQQPEDPTEGDNVKLVLNGRQVEYEKDGKKIIDNYAVKQA